MSPGDLVTTGKYGGDVPILSASAKVPPSYREFVGGLRKGEIALVVERDGADVRILCREGVGWVWHGNLQRVEGESR